MTTKIISLLVLIFLVFPCMSQEQVSASKKDNIALLKEYQEMLNEARETAVERMLQEANKLKADAIINVRFATSQIMASAAEILVYGTAVKLR